MATYAQERALDRIEAVARAGHDAVTFWSEVAELISPVVPNFMGPCFFTIDPASLLMTSHFNPVMQEPFPHEFYELEYLVEEAHDHASVARSPAGISTLHEACGGDPTQSVRWQANQELGGDQELLLALRNRAGDTWGMAGMYRENDRPHFDADEMAFLRAAAPALAEGARHALVLGEASDPEGPDAPAVLVLSDAAEVESATPGAERWVSELPDGDWDAGRLGQAIASVAVRALRGGEDVPGEVAVARVQTRSGTWMVVHGAALVGNGPPRVAIILEPASPARITPLLMSAYGLTEREQEVTLRVLQGDSTAQIAERLVVSPHTVQEHLKNIFEKTGVRSRRDLVGKVFFNHYEPRVRDNEGRIDDGRPLRGGPL
jgi:DNA-binding CsgD family transcriptional regulator